mmetsp:Transcript_57388/g.124712  ORF Transcript_57388/g.124712 Transcript_57388/m.124712 type:complete len:352 (-) Transcript_57388:374-1429(-)
MKWCLLTALFVLAPVSKASVAGVGARAGGAFFGEAACRAIKHVGSPELQSFQEFIRDQQQQIVAKIQEIDGGAEFLADPWVRENSEDAKLSAAGCMCVLEDGCVFEKAGVGVTITGGVLTEARARAMSQRGTPMTAGSSYAAAALSLVFHARNPMQPTFRADVRVFEVLSADGTGACRWYGGGADLTPAYLFEEDATEFHQFYRDLCDAHACADYKQFKSWCDSYFYLPCRGETRGIGGIFFDDLADEGAADFTRALARSFIPSYEPIVARRRSMTHTPEQREWQLLRRGRYLEFNLLYDRGVRFGLESGNGRTDNIMVSAPPLIRWAYKPPLGPEEERIQDVLRKPRDWA